MNYGFTLQKKHVNSLKKSLISGKMENAWPTSFMQQEGGTERRYDETKKAFVGRARETPQMIIFGS
jgi:hypothetical protein